MPKVLGYTPDWLSRPSPGYHLFAPKQTNGNGIAAKKQETGPRKTIATRGSEIFVAAGHEIRWADLVNLKEGTQPAYRALKVSIPLPITRLNISPAGDYLAVSTSHTVHVIYLPDSSQLSSGDDSPIRPKTFQVGPTVHVLEESPIATTLWHPLGYHGRCLLTITKAGVVRLWEINRADRSTFSEPSLSVDLPKLANATNDQDDLSASKFGASKGFSPDSVELEIASACFGDFPDQEGVHGWAPMTLWIATVPGDVYALCPLLPSKWQLVESPGATTFLQTLNSSINIDHSELSDDDGASKFDVKTSEKQVAWLYDILYSEPFSEELLNGDTVKVYNRPTSVPAVPLLQGPFTISPEVDDFELSDMIVFSLKTLSEDPNDEVVEGVPTAVVALLTDTSKVHICLDLDGIVGRWLPSAEDEVDMDDLPEHDLIIAESIELVQNSPSSFSHSITADVQSDFAFFVSHASGVFYVSLEAWVRKLETELSQPQTEGSDFRLRHVLESASSLVEHYIQRKSTAGASDQPVTSAVVLEDGNIGYLLLTSFDDEPVAVQLDAPEEGLPTEEELAEYMNIGGPQKEVREAWQPPKELYEPFDLLHSISIPSRHRSSLKEEIKLSPANLELLMDVHRVLSAQTSKLQHAVSDLFNRATRLQEEFRDQIARTSQVASSIDNVTGTEDDGSDDASAYGAVKIDERLDRVQTRQDEINARYESLRRKMASISSTELSEKEAGWVEELQAMDSAVDSSSRRLTDDVDGNEHAAWERVNRVKEEQKRLGKQVEELTKAGSKEGDGEHRRSDGVKVPSHSRKAETEQVQELIERISVLNEAAVDKLRSAGIAIPAGR
ncbi:hypothetical protein ACN47E_004473 [Coniothyrium glycines]